MTAPAAAPAASDLAALPEAPASISIRCSLRELEVTVTVRDIDARRLVSTRLPAVLDALERLGASPLSRSNGHGPAVAPDPSTLCPIHSVPMTAHSANGQTWHSHKAAAADGSEYWCRGKERRA